MLIEHRTFGINKAVKTGGPYSVILQQNIFT
jgi:hypothetical protein